MQIAMEAIGYAVLVGLGVIVLSITVAVGSKVLKAMDALTMLLNAMSVAAHDRYTRSKVQITVAAYNKLWSASGARPENVEDRVAQIESAMTKAGFEVGDADVLSALGEIERWDIPEES